MIVKLSCEVTVGICAYNEENNIGRLLDNILEEQNLPIESEIFVVCSGCTDNTVNIVNRYTKRDHRVHVYVENERKGKASAVNHILSKARGYKILFISADTLPKKACFKRLLSRMQNPNVGIVCGNPVPVNSSTSLVDRFVQILWGFHDYVFEQLNDAHLARHATEIFCVRKGIVNQIPARTVNDDAYIALAARKKGFLVNYDHESRVLICGPRTFRDYVKQRRRILMGHRQIRKMTGESPQHLFYLFPLYPIRVIKLLRWPLIKYGPTFLVFLFVEMLINIVAMFDSIVGKAYTAWSISTSTKRVMSV